MIKRMAHRLHPPCRYDVGARAPVPDDADELRAQRGPGLRHGAALHARRSQFDRTARRPAASTRCSRNIPAVENGRPSTATACSTASTSPTSPPSSKRSKISKSATHRAKPPSAKLRAVLGAFGAEARNIETALLIPIAPPAIPGIGTTGGFEFWIQDKGAGDPIALDDITQQFLAKARARPELTGLTTTFRASRSSCGPKSIARRRCCSACRSKTSTARYRRSSARSR